jgi:hypothetical protein
MSELMDDLDAMLQRLTGETPTPGEAPAEGATEPNVGDAIDRARSAPRRTTAVTSLHDAPEVAAFRRELEDGMIRADTANQLLRLVTLFLDRVR